MIQMFQNMSQDYIVITIAIIAILVYSIISRICKVIERLNGYSEPDDSKVSIKIGGGDEEDDTCSESRENRNDTSRVK